MTDRKKLTYRAALQLLDEVASRVALQRGEHASLQEAAMILAVLVAEDEKRQSDRVVSAVAASGAA